MLSIRCIPGRTDVDYAMKTPSSCWTSLAGLLLVSSLTAQQPYIAPCEILRPIESADTGRVWVGGVVPYTFVTSGSHAANANQQSAIRGAMDELENLAGLSFVALNGETDYIEIQNSLPWPNAANYSYVGRIGGGQTLQIYNWQTSLKIMVHELLHALGFGHEQTRPDRGLYVDILYGNILPGKSGNFALDSGAFTGALPYDFDSVMHYSVTSFGDPPGSITINVLVPVDPGIVIGQRSHISTGDISGLRAVYGWGPERKFYTFYGDAAYDYFGTSVAGAGDVNQDGYADVIVGAPYDDDNGSYSGSARVLSGVDGSILYTFLGDSAEDRFGYSVAGAGDVNQDGYDDLIVGALSDDDNGSWSGSARVFSGLSISSTGLSCTVAPCEFCPSMIATTSGGAPTLNNGTFALELLNAPSNMEYAILGISGTPCVLPGETFLLPFCDTIKVPYPLEFLAVMPFISGMAPCTTNILVPAPVPSDPVFLGFPLGVQWVVSCNAGSYVGKSVSNCVSFVVTQ